MNAIIKKMGVAALTISMLAGVFAMSACNDHKHSLNKVEEVKAGCETTGNSEYYACECGKWFQDETAQTEITDKTTVTLPAVGHSWDDGVISEDGTQKVITCLNCTKTKTETITVSYGITYNYNYEGAPEADVIKYEGGKPASAPENPVRLNSEYTFGGWYTDELCEDKYDFTETLNGDVELYARWKKDTLFVFEAEYINVKRLFGKGWSNEASGVNMIRPDTNRPSKLEPGDSGASNGFYLSYLYVKGIDPTFEIVSDKDVDYATLTMRLSGEILETISLTSDEFVVEVNGEKIDYPTILIDNIPSSMDAPKRAFQDFLVTTSLSLKKGVNSIRLVVNNSKFMGGTASATAPLIDCIKIATDATLDWEKDRTANLDGKE